MSDIPESDGDLLRRLGTNSELWAAEFVKRFPGLDGEPGSLVHAWFANAIGAGQSDCHRAVAGEQAVIDAARKLAAGEGETDDILAVINAVNSLDRQKEQT